MLESELPGVRQFPLAQLLLDQTKVRENSIHWRQDVSVIRDIAKRLHLVTGRDERERQGFTCHLVAGPPVPACQIDKHGTRVDYVDHSQHPLTLRSPSSAANG